MPSSAVRAFSEPHAYFVGIEIGDLSWGCRATSLAWHKVEDRATIRNVGAGGQFVPLA